MKTLTENLTNQEMDLESLDMLELGRVSEETRGSSFGHSWDGGLGVKWP